MSGYRHSGFDPNAYEQPGGPMRPFNAVQWTGVGLGLVGVSLFLLSLAGKLAWFPRMADIPSISGIMPLLVGSALINSRRAPSIDVSPEQRSRNHRMLIITAAICAVVLGAAAIIEFSGA